MTAGDSEGRLYYGELTHYFQLRAHGAVLVVYNGHFLALSSNHHHCSFDILKSQS